MHKPSGQARVIIDGRHQYLGPYASPESRQEYARLSAERFRPGSCPPMAGENRDQLRSVIKHHIVAGSKPCNEASGMRNFPALGGGTLAMGISDGKTTVNGAVIALSDVPVTNGMVHVIDQVLMPKQ